MLAIATATLAAAAGCGGGSEESVSTKASTLTVTGSPTATVIAVTGEVAVGGAVWAVASVPGAVWVQVDPPVDAMVRLDSSSLKVTARVEGGRRGAFDGEDLWIARGDSLLRVDPESGEVRGTIPTEEASYVALGEGAVWTSGGSTVARIDPNREQVVERIPVGRCLEPKELEAGHGALWLACKGNGVVLRLDVQKNRVAATIRTGAGAHDLAMTEDAVWVTNYEESTVARIDPKRDKVVAKVREVGGGVGILSADGLVWAASSTGIARIDPKTNEISGTISLGPGFYYGLAFADGSFWATVVDESKVYRVDPTAAE